MNIYVLNRQFEKIALVDDYESLLWITRYSSPGEFELYTRADTKLLEYLVKENYLISSNFDNGMIIESIQIVSDVENGNRFTIKGRGFESLLDRRIVWNMTDFNDTNVQTAIKRLLNENAINPSDTKRKIPNLIFEDSTDTAITSKKISLQVTGDNLLETIENICDSCKIGFKITLNSNNKFVFKLYSGVDRSYRQSALTYVVFASNFDNIVNTNYYQNEATYKNVTLVAGEGEDDNRITLEVGSGNQLDRRELYTDARDIQSKDEQGEDIPLAEYKERLKQRGLEKLAECKREKTFDGEVNPEASFIYKQDYFLGDIVQIRNEYMIEGCARITEYTVSDNTSEGLVYYPTFEAEDMEE